MDSKRNDPSQAQLTDAVLDRALQRLFQHTLAPDVETRRSLHAPLKSWRDLAVAFLESDLSDVSDRKFMDAWTTLPVRYPDQRYWVQGLVDSLFRELAFATLIGGLREDTVILRSMITKLFGRLDPHAETHH